MAPMSKVLARLRFTQPDIEDATKGKANSVLLRYWVGEGLFNTELPDPPKGLAREFPLSAVYEAAFLSKFLNRGVPAARAKRWNRELLRRLREGEPLKLITWTEGDDEPLFRSMGDMTIDELLTDHGEAEVGFPGAPETLEQGSPADDVSCIKVPQVIKRVDRVLKRRHGIGE